MYLTLNKIPTLKTHLFTPCFRAMQSTQKKGRDYFFLCYLIQKSHIFTHTTRAKTSRMYWSDFIVFVFILFIFRKVYCFQPKGSFLHSLAQTSSIRFRGL